MAFPTAKGSSKPSLSLVSGFRNTLTKTRPEPSFGDFDTSAAPELSGLLLLLGALFDILNYVANCLQLFGVFVRDFDGKFLFKCHHQFNDIQRRSEERRVGKECR